MNLEIGVNLQSPFGLWDELRMSNRVRSEMALTQSSRRKRKSISSFNGNGMALAPTTLIRYQRSPSRHSADKGACKSRGGVLGKGKTMTHSLGVGINPSGPRMLNGPPHKIHPNLV
jgi:hypothetical protein